MDHRGSDRRIYELSEDQLERIAQRAAELVWEDFQREIGKGTIKVFLWLTGLAGSALFAWLAVTGKIGKP